MRDTRPWAAYSRRSRLPRYSVPCMAMCTHQDGQIVSPTTTTEWWRQGGAGVGAVSVSTGLLACKVNDDNEVQTGQKRISYDDINRQQTPRIFQLGAFLNTNPADPCLCGKTLRDRHVEKLTQSASCEFRNTKQQANTITGWKCSWQSGLPAKKLATGPLWDCLAFPFVFSGAVRAE